MSRPRLRMAFLNSMESIVPEQSASQLRKHSRRYVPSVPPCSLDFLSRTRRIRRTKSVTFLSGFALLACKAACFWANFTAAKSSCLRCSAKQLHLTSGRPCSSLYAARRASMMALGSAGASLLAARPILMGCYALACFDGVSGCPSWVSAQRQGLSCGLDCSQYRRSSPWPPARVK